MDTMPQFSAGIVGCLTVADATNAGMIFDPILPLGDNGSPDCASCQ
jgi:hypothetical protein